MAGIPFLSRIKALAGILVRTDIGADKKEVILNNSPDQALNSTLTVSLPDMAGTLAVKEQVILTSDRGSLTSPNAVASLVSGKVPLDQLPNLSITNVYTVADEAARLALGTTHPEIHVGDVAIQTDDNSTWILTALPTSTAANWTLITASNAITEVNGVAGPGAITLTAADIGAVDVTGDTMSGVLTMGPNGPVGGPYTVGEIAFRTDSDTNLYSVSLKAPVNASLTDYVSLTLPATHGDAGQVLSTSGSTGILSWIDNTAANAVVTVNGESGPNVTLDAADVGAVAVNGSNYMTNLLRIHRHDTIPGATGGIQLGDLSSATAPNYVTLRAPDSVTTSYTVTLPSAAPTAGQTLLAGLSGATTWGIVPGTLDHPTSNSTFEFSKNNVAMTGTHNTAIGVGACDSLITGAYNTGFGYNAGTAITSGARNVAIGSFALQGESIGSSNTAIGTAALNGLSSGSWNVGIGDVGGGYLDSGSYNTFLNTRGATAPGAILAGVVGIGTDNTGNYAIVTANNQFVLGTALHRYYMLGKVESDLSIGSLSGAPKSLRFYDGDESAYVAFKAPTTIAADVTWTLPSADGSSGQSLLTNGSGELSWGAATGSLSHPTTGSTFESTKNNVGMIGIDNTAIGVGAGDSITNGSGNTFLGKNAGTLVAGGGLNVGIGSEALHQCIGGGGNVGIGYYTLHGIFNGSFNVALGYLAGQNLSSNASYNTIINSQGTTPSANVSGIVSIGSDSSGGYATASASNQYVLGTALHRYYMLGKIESDLSIGSLSGAPKSLKFFNGAEDHFVAFKADAATSASSTYTLPLSIGSAGQVMQTSATGALSWATVVKSVNSVSPADGNGTITLVTDDIAERVSPAPVNLWFTDARAQTAIYGTSGDLTADRALISSSGGKVAVSTTTAAQIGYLSTVTSDVQTQINGKVSKSGDSMTGNLTMNATAVRFANTAGDLWVGFKAPTTPAGQLEWTLPAGDGAANQALQTNGAGTLSWASFAKKVNDVSPDVDGFIVLTTSDIAEGTNLYYTDARAQGAITGGASTIVTTDLTADRALVSNGAGKVAVSATTSAQIGYLSTVTSDVQTQINGKVSKSGDTMTGILTMDKYGVLAGQTGTIKLGDQSPTAKYVSLSVPDALTNSYSIILPPDVGAEHYVLASAGGGATVWEIPQDSVARTAIAKLENSRGVYAGPLSTGDLIDIAELASGELSEYPIVQIYKNTAGVWTNVNIEFEYNANDQTITFGEIVDGPIDAVVHVLALVSPIKTLLVTP